MALDTYAELQTAIPEEADRSDWAVAKIKEFIRRAEGELNQKLKSDDATASLTGTIGSRYVSTSSYAVLTPIALWITVGGREKKLNYNSASGMTYLSDSAEPTEWTFDAGGKQIIFNTVLDQAYPIRFVHIEMFELSDTVTTNWLLEKFPNVYLNASLAEGYRYAKDYQTAAGYDAKVKKSVGEIRRIVADRKRGRMKVDPALTSIGVGSGYDIRTE
ncbi:phage adaptor protein [Roseibium sp.]|uniref:phage adaptor protein n=1 Tax=Roseibium sp. TaxID=1936156 RepID=UPI003B51E2AF